MRSKIFFSLAILLFFIASASAQDTTGAAITQKKFDRLKSKRNSVVLDVRTADEYKSGYIGNAINYNVMDSLGFLNNIASFDKNKKYLLYCKSGRRSGKAVMMMKNMGFRKVYHLQGGITDWKGGIKKP
jgi:phage shock protein E